MNKHIISLFFLLFFLYPLIVNADTFVKYAYTIRDGDSFASILKMIVKSDSIINANTPMVKETIKSNPQIEDWRELRPGQRITLYVNPVFIDNKKIKKEIEKKSISIFKEEVIKKENKSKKRKHKKITKLEKIKYKKNGLYASMFYMASIGTFNQKNADETVNIEFNQNSPWSIGLSSQYYFFQRKYSITSSFYLSSLESPKSNISKNISMPNEIGGNMYFQYDFRKYNISFYAGSDIERNSSFTLDILKNNKEVVIKNNLTTYITLGTAYFLPIKKSGLFAKLSYSKSMLSNSKLSSEPNTERVKYNSYKIMLYLNYKFTDKWFIHSLYKYHNMSGEDYMNISRVGFGFGYILR